MKFLCAFFCLILSQLALAQANREALIREAFDGLPFYMFATTDLMDDGFNLTGRIQGFSEKESMVMRELMKVLELNHSRTYQIKFCQAGKCLSDNGQPINFELEKGQEPRTAITGNLTSDPVYINLDKLNAEQTSLDFVEAVHLMAHEASRKLSFVKTPEDEQLVDSTIAKVISVLRNHYSVFETGDGRRVHILAIDRPNRFESLERQRMQSFWIEKQGFEVTTFLEVKGHFTSIEEIRHRFANPGLVTPFNMNDPNEKQGLSRNSIIGVEADHFSDGTTTIRISAEQRQQLFGTQRFEPYDFSSGSRMQEFVIQLRPQEKPKVSVRQATLPNKGVGILASFQIKNGKLIGDGLLPIRHGDLQEYQLHLLVRTNDGLLNIPLQIISKDPEGPVIFKIDRKISGYTIEGQLVATDILVTQDLITPVNRIPLREAKTINLPGKLGPVAPLKVRNFSVKAVNGQWISMTNPNGKIQLGENTMQMKLLSDSPLQELTLYIRHSRYVYDPADIEQRNRTFLLNNGGAAGPSKMNTVFSQEYDLDVFRIDAKQMKQSLQDGILTVEFPVMIREATLLEQDFGPYQVGARIMPWEVRGKVHFSADWNGEKVIEKVVAVNENMQKISVTGGKYKMALQGKNGAGITDKEWREYRKHFAIDLNEDDSAKDPHNNEGPSCKSKFE